jgi:hypothetical protein
MADETPDEEVTEADPPLVINQYHSRTRPKRQLVWIYTLGGVKVNCID